MANGNGQPAQTGGSCARRGPRMQLPYAGWSLHVRSAGTSGFVYAIGTIEAEYPNPAIEREMQILADFSKVNVPPDPNLRRSQPRTRIGSTRF